MIFIADYLLDDLKSEEFDNVHGENVTVSTLYELCFYHK